MTWHVTLRYHAPDRECGGCVALARGRRRGDLSRMTPNKIVLAEKFASITEHWEPRIVGELNGQHVKVAAPARA